MSKQLIRQVAQYCWSNKFIDIFREYFRKYGHYFEDAPDVIAEGEHNLQYYTLFQDYLRIYEETLTSYLSTLNIPIEEFYKQVRETKDDTNDPYLTQFIDCLLASMDYDSFYKVMVKEGKLAKSKRLSETIPQSSTKSLDDINLTINDHADSKEANRKEYSHYSKDEDLRPAFKSDTKDFK